MQTMKLPNGAYVFPPHVRRFACAKHFWNNNYYVYVVLADGGQIDAQTELSEANAKRVRADLEQQFQAHHSDVDAWNDGYDAGLSSGRDEGYRQGYAEGERQAFDIQHEQAEAVGTEKVLNFVRSLRDAVTQELRYENDLVESAKRRLWERLSVLDEIIDRFTTSPTIEEYPAPPLSED